MKPAFPSPSVFDDRDRARAHERLGAVDDLGADHLRDPLWPSDDDRGRRPRHPPRPTVADRRESDAAWAFPAARAPLRLLMAPSLGRGVLDGAWWPQSRDLAVELADLLDNLPTGLGRPMRVVYSQAGWAPAPRWINVARGRPIRAGAFPGPDTQRLLLQMGGATILELMVVPPELGADVADRAMRAAASATNRLSALTLVAEAAVTAPDASRWDDDGGPSRGT